MSAKPVSHLEYLQRTVVQGGFCVGCGACSLGQRDSPVEIELDACGRFTASLKPDCSRAIHWTEDNVGRVCPFSDEAVDESELAEALFAGATTRVDQHIGYYQAVYLGAVCERDFRSLGSSGGFGSWILCELMRQGLVDGVVHVRPGSGDGQNDLLFKYKVSRSEQEIMQGAKSHYYPVEMSEVLREVREVPGRYVFVGIPCFVKSIRLLAREDPVFRKRVAFCVGLFCGHLKSKAFADCLAWQCGVQPDCLQQIDFRVKLPNRPASQYGVEVVGRLGEKVIKRQNAVSELFGGNWGHGFFKYQACDYCDDVVAETADVSVGDAWLPDYVSDWRGTNVVVVRNTVICALVEKAISTARLNFHKSDAGTVVRSQEGAFRHRRQGLAYRLHLCEEQGFWHPPKRVRPSQTDLSRWFCRVQKLRMQLTSESHKAWQYAMRTKKLADFERLMAPYVRQYARLYAPTFQARALGIMKRTLKAILRFRRKD